MLHTLSWCLPVRVSNAKKNIYTLHDLIPLRFPHLTLDDKSVYHDLVSWCCRTADLIVAVSEHTRNEIINYLGVPATKVVNTFQSIDPEMSQGSVCIDEIKSSLRSIFGLTYAGYFLLVGTIELRKNVARAIDPHLSAWKK